MRRQSQHKSPADTETSMLGRESRNKKHTNSARYVVAFFCVASLLVFLFRPTPDTVGKTKVQNTSSLTTTLSSTSEAKTATVSHGGATHVPSADIVEECLFNLKHYHEVLTEWMSGDPTMTDEQFWEQLKFSDDIVLAQSNGSKLDARGIKSVVLPAKSSAPGWSTKPTEIKTEIDANNQVIINFKEIQKGSGRVIVILDSVALCRRKASSSNQVDFETEFYSIKEKVHKQGAALREHNDS